MGAGGPRKPAIKDIKQNILAVQHRLILAIREKDGIDTKALMCFSRW